MSEVLSEFWVHDPYILPVTSPSGQGTYHLYYSAHDLGGVVLRTSTDLRHWSAPSLVFAVPDDCWADPDRRPWAPEVHHHGGRYHLFTTLHQPGSALPEARQGGTVFTTRAESGNYTLDPSARGCITAVADSPDGPFTLLDRSGPVTPPEFMALDGTLFVDEDDQPWMVYAHEWVQLLDGTIEAVPLSPDLSGRVGEPVHLFRGSEAPWWGEMTPSTTSLAPYVTDGPQLRRLSTGALVMLWSSYRRRPDGGSDYVQTQAHSASGTLSGPWIQGEVLDDGNAGHGMVFDSFDGTPMMVLHRGMNTSHVRGELFDLAETENGYRVVRARPDLHGR